MESKNPEREQDHTRGPFYYAAACQTAFSPPRHREQIPKSVDRMCEMIKRTIISYEPFYDVRLLVFPEYAHGATVYDTVQKLRDHITVQIPNEYTEQYHKLAREYGCTIQTGSFLEWDPDYPDAVFNTTLLIGPDGILSKYRKVNPWIPWEVSASPHDFEQYYDNPFPVAETELGILGVAICYDWMFPETIREIAFQGAEVILRVSAYMDPWGATPPMDWWTLFNRARAIENMVYVVAANQGTTPEKLPPYSWPGASMVVDYEGRIQVQTDAGPGEKIVVGPIDIGRLRHERQRRRGHDTRAHLRSEIHTYMDHSVYPPAHPKQHPITIPALNERIQNGKQNTTRHR